MLAKVAVQPQFAAYKRPLLLLVHKRTVRTFRGTGLVQRSVRGARRLQVCSGEAPSLVQPQHGENTVPAGNVPHSPSVLDTLQQRVSLRIAAVCVLAWYGGCHAALDVIARYAAPYLAQCPNLTPGLAIAIGNFINRMVRLSLAAACYKAAVVVEPSRKFSPSPRELFVWPGWQKLSDPLLGWGSAYLFMAVPLLLCARLFQSQQIQCLDTVLLRETLAAGWPAWGLVIGAELLLAPAALELVFRALLVPRLANVWPAWVAQNVSAMVAFCADPTVDTTEALGHRVCDALYLSTRSLWPSFILSVCCGGVRLAAVVVEYLLTAT